MQQPLLVARDSSTGNVKLKLRETMFPKVYFRHTLVAFVMLSR